MGENPSARLTLLSTSGAAGFRLLPLFHSTFAYTMCSLYRVARSVLIQVLFTLVLWGPRCALGCTWVLGSFDIIFRLAHKHSCFMSHTRFDSLWACHFCEGWPGSEVPGDLIQLVCPFKYNYFPSAFIFGTILS